MSETLCVMFAPGARFDRPMLVLDAQEEKTVHLYSSKDMPFENCKDLITRLIAAYPDKQHYGWDPLKEVTLGSTERDYEFGRQLEVAVSKIVKPEFCRAFGSKSFVEELFNRGYSIQILAQLRTLFPLSCEGYLIAGLFSQCLGPLVSRLDQDIIKPSTKITMPWICRLVKSLTARKRVLGCKTIREALDVLKIQFSWTDVEEFNMATPSHHIVLDEDSIWAQLERYDDEVMKEEEIIFLGLWQ